MPMKKKVKKREKRAKEQLRYGDCEHLGSNNKCYRDKLPIPPERPPLCNQCILEKKKEEDERVKAIAAQIMDEVNEELNNMF